MRSDEQRHGRVDARDLFDDDRGADRVVSGAAVLFGHHDAEQSLLGQLRNQLGWKTRVLIALAGAGCDFADGELAHRLFQHALLFGQFEIHDYFLVRVGPHPHALPSLTLRILSRSPICLVIISRARVR